MKKLNFKWLVVLCMAMGIVNAVKAQIYSSECCFYTEAGLSYPRYVVKFEGNQVWLRHFQGSQTEAKKNLAKSKDFYEDDVWSDKNATMYEYDYYKSTSSKEVYKMEGKVAINCSGAPNWCQHCVWNGPGCGRHGYRATGNIFYVAFSKDKSSFIKWKEKKDNYDGQIYDRKDYSRIPKEDLLPKAVNYDFLH